jgi:hypothetical protein
MSELREESGTFSTETRTEIERHIEKNHCFKMKYKWTDGEESHFKN